MTITLAYGALFFSAFLAATIVPAGSEVGLALLIDQMPSHIITLIAVASLGNILGALVNWYLGGALIHLQTKRWFPVSAKQLAAATSWFQRYGKWSLLLSWVPVIGDPLTVAAGLLRVPLITFLVIVSIAKTSRYIIIAGVVSAFI